MLDISKLNHSHLKDIDFTTIKTNKKIEYLNIESAFDIETTSYKINDQKTAFMYIWMFGIGLGQPIYYGRTWDEFISLCELLQQTYDLNENRRLVIYVHNLGYEFQFMRKYFEWESVFSVGERKPIKALCQYGIEFRDSYILSGYSLAKTAENLQNHKVEKMVGDLDYSLLRTHKTKMSDVEMGYCKNDIEIILAYISEQIEFSGDITKIPMTNTGRVRSYVRNECYYTSTNHRKSGKGKYTRYRKIMSDLTLDSKTYKQLKRSFMGGFTHSNANHTNKTLENVTSIDFTSSYPSVMLAEQFPMSRAKTIEVSTAKQLDAYCSKYCLLFEAKFINIRCKISQENYLSSSKCYILKGETINNGRVHSADELAITITDVDYDIIKQCYEWDEILVTNVNRFHKGYLPKSIIESVLKLYEDKTVLKDVAGKEVEYMLSKGMLNSVYGMCVTDVVKDDFIYNGEWGKQPADIDEQIEKYNNSKSRFLYYAWGVWVTAYSRRNLWTGIIAMGEDYVYSDTDSIKLLNYEKHKPYIEWYDKMTIQKLETMCEHYKIDVARLHPKNQKGSVKTIGIWDYEGTYDRFKTLGAKRYLLQQNDYYQLTVAGLSKKNGMEYIKKKAKNNSDEIFNLFNDNLYIPADETGKMTHTYIDEKLEFMVLDYQNNESFISVESAIHLEQCEFTLSISEQYNIFLNNLSKGYIFEGVQYQ